jgi:hypothetical protein
MSKLLCLATAIGLSVVPACKSSTRHNADRAAERALDKSNKLGDRVADQTDAIKKQTDETIKKAADTADATSVFEARRVDRVRELRVVRDVVGSQPTVMTQLASHLTLSDSGRADVDDKIRVLQMRIDEAGNVLSELSTISIEGFKDKDDQAADVMSRLDDARKAAWDALDKAPRTARAS